jgi:hypothetical protein
MAIRDRLIARCQKLLPAGTRIRHVFRCNSYVVPASTIVGFLMNLTADYFIVAVTADEIFVLRASSWWPTYPKMLETRFPRDHLFKIEYNDWDSLNADITLMGRTYRVFCTHFAEVEAADADLKPPSAVDERAIEASIMASRAAVFRRG